MSDLDTVVSEGSGSISITRERKPFPLAPKGEHKAVCVKAKVEERIGEKGSYMSLSLMWELEGLSYKDDNGEDRKYMVFTSYGLSFGPRAKLHQVLKALTSQPPRFSQKTEKRGTKTYITDEFNYKQFVGMTAMVMVAHKEVNGNTYANVVDLSATSQMQQYNQQYLPEFVGEVKSLETFSSETVTAGRKEVKTDLGFDESTPAPATVVHRPTTPVESVVKAILECTSASALEGALAIMVEGTQYSDEDKAKIDAAVEQVKATFTA